MSEIDDGGWAFSRQDYTGMSLRQWYAGMALQGILQLLGSVAVDFGGPERTAKMSYDVADAMIRAGKGDK